MSDHEIKVNYYRVREGIPLHETIVNYHKKCAEFVRYAEALVARYKADSAVLSSNQSLFELDGLNFTDKNAPLNWEMDVYGYFHPKKNADAAADFACGSRGYRKRSESSYMRHSNSFAGVRFGTLGGDIVISLRPDEDGAPRLVPGARLLGKFALEDMKAKASKEEIEHFKELGRYISFGLWTPAPLFGAKVFIPSEEVSKLNKERQDAHTIWGHSVRVAFKHSHAGRILRRAVAHLGL